MEWFQTVAPIRQKTLVAFGLLAAIGAVAGTAAALLPWWAGIACALGGGAVAFGLGMRFREAICVPYVTTVVRMEALAAGDLTSPIQFTEYKDCVGRMTTAMFAFRDTAQEQIRVADEQSAIVKLVGDHLDALARGDLTCPIDRELPPAYLALKTNYNAAVDALGKLIGAVNESTATIRTGSTEIASASEDLARRTEGNAASLEETSAAIGEMDGRLKATADSAVRTVERASQATVTVRDGRARADEAVEAMGRVSASATGIDGVIEGLDKIAFQTRVLAMNAAVEAGRAGEAGRGFAVVADLVSALAMRAEEEAKRAREQLTVTQGEIGMAVDTVKRVDEALANITGDVTTVNELLGSIASDNQSQALAVTEIRTAVNSMDQSTQQNAAMVEETSAAARNLAQQVEALAEQAAHFVVPGDARGAGRMWVPGVRPLPAAAIGALRAPGMR
jgi:methyl-accepting chemotaxis protein